jgi:urate oxidase
MHLADAVYGKAQVRLVKVTRRSDQHDLDDLTIDLTLRGGFDAAYTAGDNRDVLPTDTMRSTAYALAADHLDQGLEHYAIRLATRLLEAAPAATEATVHILAEPWTRVAAAAFAGGGPSRRAVSVRQTASDLEVRGGISGLPVFKTAGAAFSGFLTDEYTTLLPAEDRLLATTIQADWRYGPAADYEACAATVPGVLVQAFAGHDSRSLQHTLYAMGEAALDASPDLDEIHLVLPNRHHLPVDLAVYGMDDRGELYVATDQPFGLIEGTIRRGAAG